MAASPLTTIKLTLGYDGTDFSGSQIQTEARTVEGVLFPLLQNLYSEEIRLTFSGRTDSGVHASGQVISFPQKPGIPTDRLVTVLNRAVAPDIQIYEATEIPGAFDARRHAIERVYHYWFTSEVLPVTMARYVAQLPVEVDHDVFRQFKAHILGTHNFVNFRKIGSSEKSPIRTINDVNLRLVEVRNWDGTQLKLWRFEISANAFLFRMVRNLVGVLLALWQNTMNLSHVREMLSGIEGRSFPFTVADPRGLHLVSVRY